MNRSFKSSFHDHFVFLNAGIYGMIETISQKKFEITEKRESSLVKKTSNWAQQPGLMTI